jgi:tRNA-modifying protein YgfZ
VAVSGDELHELEARQDPRLLRALDVVAPGTPLELEGRHVGEVGTACLSPARGPIGLALLRREAGPGAVLRAGEEGAVAEVVDLPFG